MSWKVQDFVGPYAAKVDGHEIQAHTLQTKVATQAASWDGTASAPGHSEKECVQARREPKWWSPTHQTHSWDMEACPDVGAAWNKLLQSPRTASHVYRLRGLGKTWLQLKLPLQSRQCWELACVTMESLGGSWHHGWESKNFPLMQKGNLRNKFIWFLFAISGIWSMFAGKTSNHKKQTGHGCVCLNRKQKQGLIWRYTVWIRGAISKSRAWLRFWKCVARVRFNARFGYRMLSKSRAELNLFVQVALHVHARFGRGLHKHCLVVGKTR